MWVGKIADESEKDDGNWEFIFLKRSRREGCSQKQGKVKSKKLWNLSFYKQDHRIQDRHALIVIMKRERERERNWKREWE